MNNAKAKREIIGLALLLDEVSDCGVFIDYSSHVKSITIRVFERKDCFNKDKLLPVEILNDKFYFDFRFKKDEVAYFRIKEVLQAEITKATEIKEASI